MANEKKAMDEIVEQRLKEAEANAEQETKDEPAGDVYNSIKGRDPKTGVQIPTKEAVEEAKDWVDNQNQM